MFNKISVAAATILCGTMAQAQTPLYQSDAYSIYPNKVVQGEYIATALNHQSLTSNYQSPANLYQSANISFKFALNGRDNEMPSGTDHHFTIEQKNGAAITPLIKFGTPLKNAEQPGLFLQPNTPLNIQLDMRDVLKDLNEKGSYTCFDGSVIYKADFKGVFVAGGTLPMNWDFDNLVRNQQLQLTDPDGDGIYTITLLLNQQQDQKKIDGSWTQTYNTSAFPQYLAPNPLSNAIYNMSLEEMMKAVEPDSTFRTGKEWAGVWTRDISYSIILSMAYLQPEVAKKSLLKKVNKKKRIIQDTGTGGAYPASTDRMIWAVAAWEVYKATGDKDWLQQAYTIVKNSIEDDVAVAYDPLTGMVRGESSFLDWREQTYPKWMQPADIFESECLGTNAVHYQANIALSEMARLLQQPAVAAKHKALANRIKKGINQYLWMPDKGYYAQFLYGRNYKMTSPRAEALGEALCILFDIADAKQATSIVSKVPLTNYGITCIYPQIPNLPPYHNNAVWPFVQTYWALAAAKIGHEAAVKESIAAIYRPAALFLTNKENFVADNGDFAGTVINSSNMLWSLSGNLALVHKIIFGISFNDNQIQFKPFVPAMLGNRHQLTQFKYRNALLDIQLEGTGNRIEHFWVDGKEQASFQLSAQLKGKHSIKIKLAPASTSNAGINKGKNRTSPATPLVTLQNNTLNWEPVTNALSYQIIQNGRMIQTISTTSFIPNSNGYQEYQVIALDSEKTASFASEPIAIYNNKRIQLYQAETVATPAQLNYNGFTGSGFVEISTTQNRTLSFTIEVPKAGRYSIDFRYTNGNGPTNTENKCAIRSLLLNQQPAGTLVFPQRGTNEWSNWGFSNAVQLNLQPGKHQIQLAFNSYNDNMNGDINQAMIDYLRVIEL